MACTNLSTSLLKGCNDSTGGIKRFLIANTSAVGATVPTWQFTPEAESVSDLGIITAISSSSLSSFYQFIPNKFSSKYDESQSSNAATGNVSNTQTITAVFSKNDAAKRNQIKLLAQEEFLVIVQDQNNRYFLLGEENGMSLTTGANTSGTAGTDLSGWTVTLTGTQKYPAREISGSLIAGITAAV